MKKVIIPWRNHLCEHYDKCLDCAAKKNALDLGCAACSHRNNKDGALDVCNLCPADLAGMLALLTAAFKPDEWKHQQLGRA